MARVIRGSGAVVPSEVVEAREEAERIVAEAEAEAARIVTEARDAAEVVRREATQAGRAQAEAEAAQLLVAAAATRDGALSKADSEVLKLAMAAAEHIVGGTLEAQPEGAIAIVRDVLARARRARHVSVRVHPEDSERIAEAFDGVEVIADRAITRGGCVVETDLGRLDARLQVRLSALEKMLG